MHIYVRLINPFVYIWPYFDVYSSSFLRHVDCSVPVCVRGRVSRFLVLIELCCGFDSLKCGNRRQAVYTAPYKSAAFTGLVLTVPGDCTAHCVYSLWILSTTVLLQSRWPSVLIRPCNIQTVSDVFEPFLSWSFEISESLETSWNKPSLMMLCRNIVVFLYPEEFQSSLNTTHTHTHFCWSAVCPDNKTNTIKSCFLYDYSLRPVEGVRV